MALGAGACSAGAPPGAKAADALFGADIPATMTVTSPAFTEGESLPTRFTCDGTNISPSLRWEKVPAEAAQLAVVVDDPDAPGGTHVHWIVVALAPTTTSLAEDAVPAGARLTEQGEQRARWQGPCPPGGKGAHTYRFSVYALKEAVPSSIGTGTKVADALDAIRARASAKGVLSATFAR